MNNRTQPLTHDELRRGLGELRKLTAALDEVIGQIDVLNKTVGGLVTRVKKLENIAKTDETVVVLESEIEAPVTTEEPKPAKKKATRKAATKEAQ